MKNSIVFSSLCLLAADALAGESATCQSQSGKYVTPLVELYTSEGCSSCPPADAWLSRQVHRNDINANFLAFHVDYWDDIGWPDRFANAAYAARQGARVDRKGSTTIYTPQIMIGEQTRVSWSWPDRSESLIRQSNAELAMVTIKLQATGSGPDWKAKVSMSSPNAITGMQWYLAVYQDGLSSRVRAGENKGKILKHDRVVRQWFGPYTWNGASVLKDFSITLSNDSIVGQTGLLAVLENPRNGQVLQSMKLPLSECKATISNQR